MMGRECLLVVSLVMFIVVGGFNSWAGKTSKELAIWSTRYLDALDRRAHV